MVKIVSVHSYRGGTGKSNVVANLAALVASRGERVGVIDTDIQSPGVHVLFGFDQELPSPCLNDYLWGRCGIADAAHDVTALLAARAQPRSKLFLVPSSINASEITRVLREGYDVGLLNEGCQDLIDILELDYLFIDTHPGLNEETLLSIAISDVLILILRPDQQDFQGTAVTVDVARRLEVPKLLLVVNKVPEILAPGELKQRVEGIYSAPVAGILPHSDEMMILASNGIFSLDYPESELTEIFEAIAQQVVI
ncbi:MAG: MinD/ParA family protein [Spirulinaceae cyanobacterium RM2_2_10]|nr:MinD/ParA family protein [Spirulinaceae cyanobacterium SM2_1_0]NJO19815.1 MinD/ParA family protein [Spirulinaceae cyanobacterium RM2_2_10]